MSEMQRERDLVLNPNEYAYVLDKTKGLISCVVGSYKMSLSTSDSLVVFNEKTKRFEEASFSDAITVFVSAPENWYITLKNPTKDDRHPMPGTSNPLPELKIGKKVNIRGNVSFALYPGQMAKAIQGHRLHSNQYLLARVYDADALEKGESTTSNIAAGTIISEVGQETTTSGTSAKNNVVGTKETEVFEKKYTIGQLLVIKGTEVPFYIPPTGIEVIPVDGEKDQYIRDAVTLEKLEYCILKDEQGNKKYIHGAAVVFPQPDETFVKNPKGGYKFKAIELSDISGIYVKVIADYKENGKQYRAGDELFITGKDQMIYYPREEHAIIDYNGRVVHHAIAIPLGEGRYVLDRKTGNIKMVKGAAMYLPDPRYEVIVKRKLTAEQCNLWYPDNQEVYEYNVGASMPVAAGVSRQKELLRGVCPTSSMDVLYNGFLGQENAVVEDGGFSRSNTYSKPRTITIDNKYDGVVSIDIWTGYAIHVISKNGSRKVITGAQTYLMEYDETLEVLELSTDRPKETNHTLKTVYLRVNNNKVADRITVETKDFVNVLLEISYCVDFLPEYKERWFNVENYIKYITDQQRPLLKREAKLHTIEDFCENVTDIVRKVALNLTDEFLDRQGTDDNVSFSKPLDGLDRQEHSDKKTRTGRFFPENGMLIHDVEVINVCVDDRVQDMLFEHQRGLVKKSLELSNANKEVEVAARLAKVDRTKADIEYEVKAYQLELKNKIAREMLAQQEELKRLEEEAEQAAWTAKQRLQELLDFVQKSELDRQKEQTQMELDRRRESDSLDIAKQTAYTDAVRKVVEAVSKDLAASMLSTANASLMSDVAEAMGPYAIANGESVAEVTNTLLRGTSLEGLLEKLGVNHL